MTDAALSGFGVVRTPGLTPAANNTVVANISGATAYPTNVLISSIPFEAADVTVGSTTITGGTTTRVLYDNAGKLGEYTITGSGTVVAMAAGPTFTAPVLGTPASGNLSNCTALPVGSVTGIVNQSVVVPTYQLLTSGTAYTPAVGVKWIRVRMVGGGGGGGGAGATLGPTGATGGTTTFNAVTAVGGSGGVGPTGGVTTTGLGGIGGTGGTGTAVRARGNPGGLNVYTSGTPAQLWGGLGGSSAFFGGAGQSGTPDGGTGGAGGANTGGGGGGASGTFGVSYGGAGGGGSESVEVIFAAPGSTYAYSLGAGGAGGVGTGTGACTGGAGGTGYIVVEEHYNF